MLGTEQFMSPEIYRCGAEEVEGEELIYGYEVDMWAFGVLFYNMLNGDFPFSTFLLIKKSIPTGP